MANNQETRKIYKDFAEKLIERKYLGQDYIVYIFSLQIDEEKRYLNKEAFAFTGNFQDKVGFSEVRFPIPELVNQLFISPRTFFQYRYARRGNNCPFNSLLLEHEKFGGEAFLSEKASKYWRDIKINVVFSGYEFDKNTTLVIFIIFAGDVNAVAENELRYLCIEPILKQVEDSHHKSHVFNKKYLKVLISKIKDVDDHGNSVSVRGKNDGIF